MEREKYSVRQKMISAYFVADGDRHSSKEKQAGISACLPTFYSFSFHGLVRVSKKCMTSLINV